MKKYIKFTIDGEPKGKGRPRFRNVGKFVQTYTDKETTNYENWVKLCYKNSNQPCFEKDIALKCYIIVYQPIIKSTSKKKAKQMLDKVIRPTKKPDIDNIVKCIFDALNGLAFYDDTQIVELIARKYYSLEPRVEVMIEEVEKDIQFLKDF